MSELKTLVAMLVLTVVSSAHAIATHGTFWSPTNANLRDGDDRGSWSVELQDGKGLWASTRGDRGALGQYCSDDGACAWLLVLWGASCSEGEQHPVLVNTDRAASHHMIQCIGTLPGIGSALAFVDFDRADAAIRGATLAGIAIPEQTDAIGIAHFKLDGAAAAVDSMRARIVAQARTE
jgi:hypothetical protein